MAEEPKLGSIVHVEFPTKDLAKAKKFYGEVFGWKFQDVPETNYTLFEAPSGPNGGFRAPFQPGEDRPLNFILVSSVDDATRKIKKAGGTILRAREEVPGQGWWALFRDPDGAVSAVWENQPKAQEPEDPRRERRRWGVPRTTVQWTGQRFLGPMA